MGDCLSWTPLCSVSRACPTQSVGYGSKDVMLKGSRLLDWETYDGCHYVKPKLMIKDGRPSRLCLYGANHQLARVFELFLSLKESFYLFWTLLGLCGCIGFSLAAESKGYSMVVVDRLLTAVTFSLQSMGFRHDTSVAVALRV